MLQNRISQQPLRRKLLPVLIIFLFITVVSLALTFAAIAVQSSVRGYVAGEGLWSKAQRDAVYLLERYARTRNPEYLKQFEGALAVPLGDRMARLELLKANYDPAAARQGFLEGGNHPEDISGMILLFRCCSRISYLQRVVDYWTQGDEHIVKMQGLARELSAEIDSATPSSNRVDALVRQVEAVNDSVRPLEALFTATLGDAARWVTGLLFLVTAGIIVVLIVLGAFLSLRVLGGIRQSEEQYRLLLNTAGDALIVVDRETGTMIEVNQQAEQIIGKPARLLIGSPYVDIFPHPDGALADSRWGENGTPPVTRHQVRHADGRGIPVEVNYSATKWGDRPVRLAIIRDITERLNTERELRVSANAMANMSEGVVITDSRRNIVSVNSAYTAITGYSEAEMAGKKPHYPMSRHNDAAFYVSLWRTVHKTGKWQGEIWNQRKNGENYPELLSISAVRDDNGKVSHYVAVLSDISAYKEYERKLEHLAQHDSLTQLPNRTTFEGVCKNAIERAKRLNSQIALLFIDLDGFKAVNDTYGHVAGDRLLQTVGVRVRTCLREDDAIARVGGDEFTVLLENVPSRESAVVVARKLLRVLSEKAPCGEHEISVFASIGISFFPDDATDVESLLTTADTAMYEAKNQGRNTYQFFSPAMALAINSRLLLTNSLKQAIERQQFELHYQPCVDLASGEITGMEALLRWQHPKLGSVPPSDFIPLAEEMGLINAITDWVLNTACRQCVEWVRGGALPRTIAVNISPHTFWDPEFPGRVGRILADTGWSATRLCLEITEGTIMSRDKPRRALDELNAMGIKLAIDDFGVGYSSLSYLQDFPVQTLKIDRSFTNGIPKNAGNVAIAKAIIALAKSLKLQVIAEGVETREQHNFLLNEGCQEGQGYLYSKPLPAAAIEQLLNRGFRWGTKRKAARTAGLSGR